MELTIKDTELIVKRISNSSLFTIDSELTMPEPKVPIFYLEEQDMEIPNPDHPLYHAAMSVYYTNRQGVMFDNLLRLSVELKNDIDIKLPKNLIRTYPHFSKEIIFLRHILFDDDSDKDRLVDNIALTETRVYNIYRKIKIFRNGVNLEEHDIKNAINTNIQTEPLVIGNHQLVHPLDEYNACVQANISWERWLNGELPLEVMANTIALFRINRLLDIHSNDAQQIASESKSK